MLGGEQGRIGGGVRALGTEQGPISGVSIDLDKSKNGTAPAKIRTSQAVLGTGQHRASVLLDFRVELPASNYHLIRYDLTMPLNLDLFLMLSLLEKYKNVK